MRPRPALLAARLFDALERRWEGARAQRLAGAGLVVAFVGTLVAAEVARRGLLPALLPRPLPGNHFAAVYVAFTLLLVLELVGLVLALGRSVADSVGKQFELLSLILLRKAFLEVSTFGEPVAWARAAAAVPHVVADMLGALAVFALVEVYYRVQRHRAIASGDDQASFVAGKKVVALLLLVALVVGLVDAARRGLAGERAAFFEVFFTVLIFSDVLLVLLSLMYSSDYRIVFRNSGFAAATLMIRLALTAPPYVNVALGVGAAAFAVLLSLAYDRLRPPRSRVAAARRASPPP